MFIDISSEIEKEMEEAKFLPFLITYYFKIV